MSSSESGVSTRKRKQANETGDDPAALNTEEVQTCRKSPRLSANRVKEAPTTPTRGRPRSRPAADESKLNGAQFVSAAAAGNLNVA